MPPSNQNGGHRKGGGPWGPGPSGGPSPNLEELLKRGQDRFKQAIPGGSGAPGLFIFLGVVVLAAVTAFYAFTFRVNADEIGIVLYLGKPDRQEPPGLHYRLPSGRGGLLAQGDAAEHH